MLFHSSSHVLLFRGIPVALPVFRCSTGVPFSVVPYSGIPSFEACLEERASLYNVVAVYRSNNPK